MSSTEPPSRMQPRGTPHDSKAARDELSSKGKVEKVREVDADEARKKKFMQYYRGVDEDENEDTVQDRPSPFDLLTGSSQTKPMSETEETVIPSPSYSPPPNVKAEMVPGKEKEEKDLPQAKEFWQKVGTPEEPPVAHKYEEKKITPVHQPQVQRQKKEPKLESKPLPSPFEAAPKERSDRLKMEKAKKQKKEEDETVQPIEQVLSPSHHAEPQEQKIREIEMPTMPPLPSHIEPMAMSSTTAALSYLTPTTVSLFYQMVGTIYIMQGQPGVERTEIVLNNPAFANSKFFGATITIEKYATAPDSFNIRLTGTHEAVVTFRENIPSLLNAFESGAYRFRIGRIDAEYTLERPIFRRKEKGEDKGEAGNSGERRNK